jgi:hypothetical protein
VEALVKVAGNETNPVLRNTLTISAIASHPQSTESLLGAWGSDATSTAWRAVLAGRLKDPGETELLVLTACDPSKDWISRRAAILALEHNESAMMRVYPVTMAERSPFTLDKHSSLLGHLLVSMLVNDEARAMHKRFSKGRSYFISLFGDILQAWRSHMMFPDESPTGEEAAAWLYDYLHANQWLQDFSAVHRLSNSLHVPILQAATLRGLRICGRSEVIESLIPSADSVWLTARMICELFKNGKISSRFLRIKSLAERNPLSEHWCIRNILSNSEPKEHKAIDKGGSKEKPKSSEATILSYEDITTALTAGNLPSDAISIGDLDINQQADLVEKLDPMFDPRGRAVPTQPTMVLTKNGFNVGGSRMDGAPQSILKARKRLRPALSAHVPNGESLSWHRTQLAAEERQSGGREYVGSLFQAIGASRNSARLISEFEENGDLLLSYFDDIRWLEQAKHLVDERLVPALLRLSTAGTDEVLRSLCHVAEWIPTEAVDELLRALFLRWHRRFDLKSSAHQHMNNRYVWMAFNSLSRHNRFKQIPDYDLRLMELLPCQMYWHNKRDIVQAIKSAPRAYVALESRLLDAAPFEHFHYDEVDELTDAAQQLFH